MNKGKRLRIESAARAAIGRHLNCMPTCQTLGFLGCQVTHEFDIYTKGIVIGGVSTSTSKTSNGNPNTGGRDRASSELLWLSLWQGQERRIHVLTQRSLAEWILERYRKLRFPHEIDVIHYNLRSDELSFLGVLTAGKAHRRIRKKYD